MFKLRKQHLEAFEAQKTTAFTTRVIAHVKAVWPAECGELGDAGVAEMVSGAIQRGAALGLLAEFDLVRYVDLGFILVKDFEKHPLSMWVRPILADPKLQPAAKINLLYQKMEEEFARIERRKGGTP